MRIHYLQHVPFEGTGTMQGFFERHATQLSSTHCYKTLNFPEPKEFDLLVIMGGPMSVNDDQSYSWLSEEKLFIQRCISEQKFILGICLGAQLLAQQLGANVTKNEHTEIGWHKIYFNSSLEKSILKGIFPRHANIFHWHSDTFTLPEHSIPIGSSQACANQGFILNNRFMGFQFHLETNPTWVKNLCLRFPNDLKKGNFIQSYPHMISQSNAFKENNIYLEKILLRIKQQIQVLN